MPKQHVLHHSLTSDAVFVSVICNVITAYLCIFIPMLWLCYAAQLVERRIAGGESPGSGRCVAG